MYARILSLSLSLVAFVAAAPAFAGTTTYPGTLCQRESGGSLVYDSAGHAENRSTTSTLNLVCPLMVDAAVNPFLGVVWVTDYSSTANLSCHVSEKTIGFTTDPAAAESTSNFSLDTAWEMELEVPTTSSPSEATWFIECSIPPMDNGHVSELRGYRLDTAL